MKRRGMYQSFRAFSVTRLVAQGADPRQACSSFLKFTENGGQAYGKARQTAGLPENVPEGQRRSDRSIAGNREKNAVLGV